MQLGGMGRKNQICSIGPRPSRLNPFKLETRPRYFGVRSPGTFVSFPLLPIIATLIPRTSYLEKGFLQMRHRTMSIRSTRKNQRGFTMLELLIAVSVMLVLSGIIAPLVTNTVNNVKVRYSA